MNVRRFRSGRAGVAFDTLIGSTTVLVCVVSPALAQSSSPPASDSEPAAAEIVVTGSRLPESLKSYPGSVTRIGEEAIESLRSFSSDPSQLLSYQVPGLGVSAAGASSNFEQSLRGRTPAVLIDGVPIGTPLRDGRRDIRSLSLSAIESVEVIRGASALYGNGGAGGVINYITKNGGGEPRFETEVGAQISLTHFDESLAPFVRQSAVGGVGGLDFVFDGYAEFTQSQFDAQGDRIRPSPNAQGGLADSSIYSLFGKVGTDFGLQRIEASLLYYKQEQDTDYNQVIPGNVAQRIKTRVAEGPRPAGAINEGNKNLVANLIYTHSDVLGSVVSAQAYYQEYKNIFSYEPTFFPGGGQSLVISDKYGARLDINTPLNIGRLISDGSILWGVDYVNDETGQPLADGRTYAPFVTQEGLAGFVQVTAPLSDRLTVRGGFRYEDIKVGNEAFDTLMFQGNTRSIPIPAGERSFTASVFNAGASYDVTEWANVFAAYSQGFSTAEVGRVLRDTRVPIALGDPRLSDALRPQEVDNYEAGVRLQFDGLRIDAAAFYSECSLCATTDANLRVIRQPDETFGFELGVDAKPADNLRMGGSFTYVDGNRDLNGDGSYEAPLPANRAPPEKISAYAEYDFDDSWSLRLQGLHSFSRDQFGNQITTTSVGVAPVKSFTLVDASVRLDLQRSGVVTLAVNNLLNEDYFLIGSYLLNRPDRFSKGPGTTLRLSYTVSY